jgi:hypothetical protein
MEPPAAPPTITWNATDGTVVHVLWLTAGHTRQDYPPSSIAWTQVASRSIDIKISTDIPVDHAFVRMFTRVGPGGTPTDEPLTIRCSTATPGVYRAGASCDQTSIGRGELHFRVRVPPAVRLVTIEGDWYIPGVDRKMAVGGVPIFDSLTSGVLINGTP